MSATVTPSGFELRGESAPLRPMLRELWGDRSLIRLLARKAFFVQYRRASIGILWAIGLPLLQAIVMAFVLRRIVTLDAGINYTVFVLSGIVPWTFFIASVTTGTISIVEGSTLATKVYFPRMIFPIVVVLANLRGYLPALGVLVVVAAALGVPLGVEILLVIPATVLVVVLAAGFCLVTAGLHVYFRDMKFIVAAISQPWFWASGVFYPVSKLGSARAFLEFNPAVGTLQLFRAAVGANTLGLGRTVLISCIWAVALIALALPLYRRYDRVFVDLM